MAAPYRKAALCRETTSSTGTGTINLDLGAKPRHQTIVRGLLTAYGDTTPGDQARGPYTILSGDGIGWESGIGTVTLGTPSTFSRDEVKEGSSGVGTHISLVGVSEIYIATEAMQVVFQNVNVRGLHGAQIDIDNYTGGTDDGSYPAIETRGANGTEAAPLYPTDGQIIGGYTAWGWDEASSSWKIAGQIVAVAEGDWSASSQATSLVFAANEGGTPTDSWNATYNTNFSLTSAGLEATTTVPSTTETIIGSSSHASGKFYFELFADAAGGEFYWGLAEAAHVKSVSLGSLSPTGGGGTAKSVAFGSFSTVFHNWFMGGAATASGVTSHPTNEWLGFAVDLDTGYILMRRTSAPTVWYGNNSNLGDPASIATHGFSIGALAGQALFLGFTSNQNATGASTIMNTGASSFQAAAPSGYGPWTVGNSFVPSLKLWSDTGLSSFGLASQGAGTLNFDKLYANDVLVSDGSGGAPVSLSFNDLTDVTISSVATSDFVAWSGSAWTNRTAVAATALLAGMVGDSGSGGTKGLVPAPAAGDAAAGKFLKADGTWAVGGGGLSTTLTSAHIYVGNGSNVGTDVAVSGDVTLANTGAFTIANNAVTNAKAAQMGAHTVKGNNTGSTANPLDLTLAQITAELNAMVGDSGSGGTKGLVPAPGAGDAAAGKFLKADGTFAIPAGTGASSTLTSAHLYVGNGSNIATDVAVTGDVTISNAGVTAIGAGKVTNAMLATAPAMVLIQTITAANQATIDFTSIGSYKKFKLIGTLLVPITNGATAQLYYGTGGTPTYAITNYDTAFTTHDSSNSGGGYGAVGDTKIVLYNGGVANASPGVSLDLTILLDASNFVILIGSGHTRFSGGAQRVNWNISSQWTMAAALTAIRFNFSSGNVNTGTLSLYGLNE